MVAPRMEKYLLSCNFTPLEYGSWRVSHQQLVLSQRYSGQQSVFRVRQNVVLSQRVSL